MTLGYYPVCGQFQRADVKYCGIIAGSDGSELIGATGNLIFNII
jgi:hypothetical protein